MGFVLEEVKSQRDQAEALVKEEAQRREKLSQEIEQIRDEAAKLRAKDDKHFEQMQIIQM